MLSSSVIPLKRSNLLRSLDLSSLSLSTAANNHNVYNLRLMVHGK